MFAPAWMVRMLATKSEENFKYALEAQKQLTAALLETKAVEAALLRSRIQELEQLVKYERAKADGLYDRLLIRDAKVAPVQAVALAQATAEAKDPKKNITEELSRVFDQLAGVGESDEPPHIPMEVNTFAGGGSAISGGAKPPSV